MKSNLSTDRIQTKASLEADLAAIGFSNGSNVMVHSSLSALGWVVGGAKTFVSACLEVIGKTGTLVMPSETPQCADPKEWDNPTVPENLYPKIRENMPLFDPAVTPTSMGAIPECFRNWPGTERSEHPLTSVCANGPLAGEIVSEHSLEFSEGSNTPFEKVYDLDFSILLLGVGFNRCTILHFAESRVTKRRTTTSRFPVMKENKRVWMEVEDMAADNSTHFPLLGAEFVEQRNYSHSKIGEADSIFFRAADLADFASDYFERTL